MLVHHDARDYHVAASQAAKTFRDKFEKIIQSGRASAERMLQQVQEQVPVDYIVPANQVRVIPRVDEDGDVQGFDLQTPKRDPAILHPHAFSQIAEKAGAPEKYLKTLNEFGQWGADLAAKNVNELFLHAPRQQRNLVREIKNGHAEVRGFLSDRFRRLDSRPLLDSFMGACHKIGALPLEGYALDTKIRMRAVLPYVFEPIDNEVMIFGIQLNNSDFGDGAMGLSLFCERGWCTNLATMQEALRQVHLGGKLDDNIAYSQKTYELDTKTNASALVDVVYEVLGPNKVNGYLEHIRTAAEQTVGEKDVARILKAKLTKGEAEKVADLFNGPDVQNLPPGKSTYRLSNAVSFFAQIDGISANRKLELQEIAGSLLPSMGLKAKEV